VGVLRALLPPCWWLTETIEGGGMAGARKRRKGAVRQGGILFWMMAVSLP
jgi:hypothetical protein